MRRKGATQAVKTAIAAFLADQRGQAILENAGLDDTTQLIRDQFFAFANEKIAPYAHEWHLKDELIPLPLIDELGAMGVFGLTIPEEFGGLGMGKTAMCVVSEELSRAWIGVGSLATRSEIAAELIIYGGTPSKRRTGFPQSLRRRFCRPLCSQNLTPGPTWVRCARVRCWSMRNIGSKATRHGSPMPPARM